MVSTETPENFSSLSIAKKIPLAFRKAKEAYVAKKDIPENRRFFDQAINELNRNRENTEKWNKIATNATDKMNDFVNNSQENQKKIKDLLTQLDNNSEIKERKQSFEQNSNSLHYFDNMESKILELLNNNEDPTVKAYFAVRREWYLCQRQVLCYGHSKNDISKEKDQYSAKLENCKISIDNYHKFYRKTVQYTINGVATFAGAAIGCFIGHAVAPRIVKKVTQLSVFNQLTPAKQTKIVKALPWVSRLTGGLLSAGIAFLATNTLVNWGHRTVLGIK